LAQPPHRSSSGYATSPSLLERVRNHDQEAWKRLVYVFSPLVCHICKRWHVAGADADDVVQEVFQAVAAGIGQYRAERDGKRAPFRSWLSGIIHHKLTDWMRQRGGQPQAEGGSHAYEKLQELPEQAALMTSDDLTATNGVCQRALQLLREEFEPQTWQAFWRTAVDGQSAVDIAGELGMSPAAVRKAKSRVLHRLKVEIGDLVE
jgi:RNA polymerase sigma-70 factor (ECF subfamily)